jgi:imidazolonepropionase-like amidohydrolase
LDETTMKVRLSFLLVFLTAWANAAEPPLVASNARRIALLHVRVIDGTGAPARTDQTIVIDDQKIAAIGGSGDIAIPPDAKVFDLQGASVIPGLVGMHDHLFYPTTRAQSQEMAFSFPRLYLAAGVTTIRTAGSIEPITDLQLKKLIDAGKWVGPKIHVTSPYLEGGCRFAADA